MRRKLAAGNWKMNGDATFLSEVDRLNAMHPTSEVDILICPPATLLSRLSTAAGKALATGGQDCHIEESGAYTGDISASMLKDAGASYVIIGHSERRQDHGETDADVHDKAQTAIGAGLKVIICVGESLEERKATKTLDVIASQLAGSIPESGSSENMILAYEPIWAIGTGMVATLEQIAEVHDFIRAQLEHRFGEKTGNGVRILYGGSVKPANAAKIFAVQNVDGALVGGASLSADDFSPIITALEGAN